MNRFLLIFVCMVFCATTAFATHVAVLETEADGAAKDKVPWSDRLYLTNVLREEAVKQLPATDKYIIMTHENIQQMLPPGKAFAECEGSCLVETGKNISADYICQARVGIFDGDLTLSAELYETAGNKLIASFNGHGTNLKELLALIEQKSPDFFKVIKNMEEPEVPEAQQNATRVNAAEAYRELDEKSRPQEGESVPANVEKAEKSHVARWAVLGVSAVVGVTGAILAIVGNNKAKDAAETSYFANQDEFNKSRDDAKSGQTLRSVGIGFAIVGAVGIGVSFAF